MQRKELTIGDFCGTLLKFRNRIESLDSTFSKKLLGNMKIREQTLFKNTVFLTVIFMYPRYAFLISDQEITIACSNLKKLDFETKKLI